MVDAPWSGLAPLPGELEQRNNKENRKNGIALPENTLGDLRKLADHMGLNHYLPF